MTYSIIFSENAAKTVKKLNVEDREAMLKKIASLRENPFPMLKKLAGSKFWRLRMGKYRAIIDIIVKGQILFVVKIDKRDKVY